MQQHAALSVLRYSTCILPRKTHEELCQFILLSLQVNKMKLTYQPEILHWYNLELPGFQFPFDCL